MSVATAITQGVTVEPVAVARLLGVIGLSVVHLGAGVLGAIDATAHRRLVSVAGGVSVSYVFVHFLPAIAEARAAIERQATWLAMIVLNAIKEELPADRAGRFWTFAAGSVAYAVLLVVV